MAPVHLIQIPSIAWPAMLSCLSLHMICVPQACCVYTQFCSSAFCVCSTRYSNSSAVVQVILSSAFPICSHAVVLGWRLFCGLHMFEFWLSLPLVSMLEERVLIWLQSWVTVDFRLSTCALRSAIETALAWSYC